MIDIKNKEGATWFTSKEIIGCYWNENGVFVLLPGLDLKVADFENDTYSKKKMYEELKKQI